ncbi:uncharacterized protein RJT20DRAFT_55656 [Scheffersomyces xylosifermentans]|uniref:uncharacterized protein n=1 Tax=Scheffersomyces xylosifermentans TaxID=1304137 RepID=UPI00315DF3F5
MTYESHYQSGDNNYTYSEESLSLDYSSDNYEDIFEFNISDEDEQEVNTPQTLPDSPLLVPQQLRLHNSDAGNYTLLYECCICKRKNIIEDHNCWKASESPVFSTLSGSDNFISNDDSSIIQHNNKLIQSNYRKWLFNATPSIPY